MLEYDGHTSEVGARHPGMGEHRVRGPLVSRSSQSIAPTLTYYLMQRGVYLKLGHCAETHALAEEAGTPAPVTVGTPAK